ncbi:FAD-dependent oxidoreductase [Corynebacterium glutamicum]|uniref:NAD(P)/FAD-dependent oxidoreductase n=1 Tax=Corynebacterium glutamicum TaxID=1718 RepID=UPI00071F9206|nr:FAD-dependent oxidoreductase [Corynebacterium glutamicum]ALP49323.1 ferredoxin [Corynebacterium glutamicum]ANU32834.1 ferredoxin [Corynebacterium glutamicum]APT06578.1 ferredoxin [Corynebacterium glutamicum]QWQ83503.1 ferredoxin [Corynebacterium glutamicum]WFP71117.1 FAD-dependent oxidoreductase [Corynebacterium glutamicum]
MNTSAETGILIIGANQSGVQLAISLRATGFTESITLLGEEDHRPYQRPALSKEFLQDKIDKERLIFRSNEYWEENNIRLVKGVRIKRIEKNDDGSGVAYGAGQEFAFRRLALAVGARPRHLDLPGATLEGVTYLRNADDALALKAMIGSVTDAVVVGGGFIGLEAACSLHDLGKNVTVLEYGPRLIGRAVGEETAAFFLEQHCSRGVNIVLDARMKQFVGKDGKLSGVELEDGTVIPAQLVIVGIGVIPNTELAADLGLDINNGIVVDKHAVASDGTTIAIGDVANIPNPIPGSPADERIRLESVNNAIEHAKIAAYSLVGQPEAYAGIPWFWSNQGDLKLQIAGLTLGYDSTVIRQDPEKKKFSVLYYRGDNIIAADCVNAPLDFMAVRSALSRNQNIPADLAADISQPLKKLAVDLEVTR